MKRFMLIVALGFLSAGAFAQNGKDYVTMKADGKMYWIRGGQTIKMGLPVPLKNGSFVYADGSLKTKDGELSKITQGDKVFMDGTVLARKEKQRR